MMPITLKSLAQKVAFLTPTGQVEKLYQQLTDFLGKARYCNNGGASDLLIH